MRVGFVVECGPGGADEKVLRHLVGVLRRDLDVRFQTCGPTGKREILDRCGAQVEKLFDVEGCDWVFVVWDLMPCNAEHQEDGKASCKKERQHLLSKLREEDKPRTKLLCITHELEAWLLADGSALTKVIGTREHPIKPAIADERHPQRIENPKGTLKKHFKRRPGYDYNDIVHARKIIEIASLTKLARVPSFLRLKEKIEGL